MSVDKFGRHSTKRLSAKKGPKGEGFDLTPEGDYNINRKRLRNVEEPIDDTDAANKHYVDSNIPLKRSASYSFHQYSIKDVGYPEGADGDAVSVKYLKDKCITFVADGSSFDAKGASLTNVKDPKEGNDVATKIYVDSNTPRTNSNVQYWSFSNKRLVSVAEPINDNDVVTLKYFETRTPKKLKTAWGFAHRRLTNVTSPEEVGDAVNLDFLAKQALLLHYDGKVFDAKGFVISNVGMAQNTNDVVNKKYLEEALANVPSPEVIGNAVNLEFLNKNALLLHLDGRGFDAKENVISNVGMAQNTNDVVSKKYLKEALAGLGYALYIKDHRKKPLDSRAAPIRPEEWKSSLMAHLDIYQEPWKAWDVNLNK